MLFVFFVEKSFERERERERERKKKERRMDGWRKRKRYENHKKKLRVCLFFRLFSLFFCVWLIFTGEKERDFLLLVEQLCATTNRFGID